MHTLPDLDALTPAPLDPATETWGEDRFGCLELRAVATADGAWWFRLDLAAPAAWTVVHVPTSKEFPRVSSGLDRVRRWAAAGVDELARVAPHAPAATRAWAVENEQGGEEVFAEGFYVPHSW